MEIQDSSLFREIQAIRDSDAKPVHYTWRAQIHVQDQTFEALKVMSVDNLQDYEENFGDEIILTAMIPGGTYAKRIYPNQSKMDITLIRYPIGEVDGSIDESQAPQTERFTATLLDKGSPLIEGQGDGMSEEQLNLTNVFEISFQLVNKALEQVRMISVGGIFRYTTTEDVIKDTLTRESQAIRVEGVRMPQGVDMVKASNQEKRDHVIIPQGTRLVDLPAYVHLECGGVYSSGISYYMQGDFWYVYPLYDVTRFNTASRTLTVINVPENKMPGSERTYRQDGRNTVVLATGKVQFRDDSDQQQLNAGNGVRFADANNFMEGFADTKNNKSVLSRGANATEMLATARPNGMNQVRVAGITANPFVEYSRLARRQGSLLSFVWENSNPAVVFPGMMAKVLWLQEGEIQEAYGVVLKAHHYHALKGQGYTSTRYGCTSSITLFVQPPDYKLHQNA